MQDSFKFPVSLRSLSDTVQAEDGNHNVTEEFWMIVKVATGLNSEGNNGAT